MQRYNLAYVPTNKQFAADCVSYAEDQFGALADGYLLNPNDAHPHVTICQFKAPEDALDTVWQIAATIKGDAAQLTFNQLYFMHGDGAFHDAKHVWTGLSVVRSLELIDYQRRIAEAVSEAGLQPLTGSGEKYFPHLTMGRVRNPNLMQPPEAALLTQALALPRETFWLKPIPFHLALGLSDENGVFLKHLKTSVVLGDMQINPAPGNGLAIAT